MWSDPAHSELSVGMEIGKEKEIGYVGVFSDEEFGTIDLYLDGKKVGSHNRGSIVMNTTGGDVEVKGDTTQNLVLIGTEQIGPELFRITLIDELKPGPVSLTVDHQKNKK